MHSRLLSGLPLSIALCAVLGCATPGPPKPPTLNLPEPTRDLTATRVGNMVELRFTIPFRSTDKLPLRGANLTAVFCRSVDAQPCTKLPSTVVPVGTEASHHASFLWTDALPAELTQGDPRLLRYTVELQNAAGRSAGQSEPAFTAAGTAPAAVAGLTVQGSRLGIVLRWDQAAKAEVVVRRENVAIAGTIQLTAPSASIPSSLIDTSAKLDTAYRYSVTRCTTAQLGRRNVELRSAPSPSVEVTLKAIYPPSAPVGLLAAASSNAGFAIDLIWQPVDEAGLIVPLAGYNVYRALGTGAPRKLNDTTVTIPAFHDGTAVAGVSYRYRVTAVDGKGNESTGVLVDVGP